MYNRHINTQKKCPHIVLWYLFLPRWSDGVNVCSLSSIHADGQAEDVPIVLISCYFQLVGYRVF